MVKITGRHSRAALSKARDSSGVAMVTWGQDVISLADLPVLRILPDRFHMRKGSRENPVD